MQISILAEHNDLRGNFVLIKSFASSCIFPAYSNSDKTKMRMVRNFEHISGMLRQQSKLTKNDGSHERNKKNIFKLKEIERDRKRGRVRLGG